MKTNGNIVEIAKYRRDKAFETLNDIKKLLANGMLSLAMNRIYYSGFYIISGLSLLDKKNFSKHKMLIGYFNKEYLKTELFDRNLGRILNDSYERRNALDYHDFAIVTKSEVQEYFKTMKSFVKEVYWFNTKFHFTLEPVHFLLARRARHAPDLDAMRYLFFSYVRKGTV